MGFSFLLGMNVFMLITLLGQQQAYAGALRFL